MSDATTGEILSPSQLNTLARSLLEDAFPLGRFLGPNLTTGQGSRTLDYEPADWDRIVRHGVLPDGEDGREDRDACEQEYRRDCELNDLRNRLDGRDLFHGIPLRP